MTQSVDHLRHEHVFLGRHHDQNARRTLWVVALTAAMMVAEIIAGIVYGSMALLADGFHMATHAGALAVAAIAYGYAKREARNPRFSFGTGKIGDLAGFASALVLAVIALAIGVESIQRLLAPTAVSFDQAIIVAVIGLAVNLVSAVLLAGHGADDHGHAHHHHGSPQHGGHVHHDHTAMHAHHHGASTDNNLRAAYLHVLADALTSVLAIAALIAGKFGGWAWLDPAMGIVGAIIIARWSWFLMRDTGRVLLDTADPHLIEEVTGLVEAPGDSRIVDLHVWRIGPDAHAAIVSVATSASATEIRRRLQAAHEITHLTVELHPS